MANVNASYDPTQLTPEIAAQLRQLLGAPEPQGAPDQFGFIPGVDVGSNVSTGSAALAGMLSQSPQFQAQQQQLAQRVNEGTQGLSPEQYAQYQQTSAQDARYGNDLSWLDPSFQYQANLLGQSAGSQAYADPSAIAAQQQAMQLGGQYATSNLQFQDPSQQNALMQQWAAIQGGQGAPSFMGNGTQQGLMQQLLGVAAPKFSGDADQRNVLNAALGFMNNSGPGSLSFDTSGRQGEQYGNLQGIIAGGGANAIEMAQRAKARGDSEAWLRGQREADMADYAERGLTGSGMELLNLSADRQAAAGRNSMADLQTSADLEKRRLDAINAASGLATNMRGQTIDEQGLLNNRATAGLGAASSVANSMRGANIQEQLGLNQALQSQFTNAAGIAGQMRGQDFSEKTYTDQRGINALGQQTDLANTMRGQTAQEQIANRQAQLSALGIQSSAANAARGQSAQEAQFRAGSTDDFSKLNQAAINNASSANTNFLQNAYQQTMNNRTQSYLGELGLQGQLAAGTLASDVGETKTGTTLGTGTAQVSAEQYNDLLKQYQNLITGQNSAGINDKLGAGQQVADATAKVGGAAGAAIDTVATAVAGGAGGGSMGSILGGATAGGGTNSLMDLKKITNRTATGGY